MLCWLGVGLFVCRSLAGLGLVVSLWLGVGFWFGLLGLSLVVIRRVVGLSVLLFVGRLSIIYRHTVLGRLGVLLDVRVVGFRVFRIVGLCVLCVVGLSLVSGFRSGLHRSLLLGEVLRVFLAVLLPPVLDFLLLAAVPQFVLFVLLDTALDVLKQVRRARPQLVNERARHMSNVERATTISDLRVEQHLQQHVGEFFAQVLLRPARHLAFTFGFEFVPQRNGRRELLGFLAKVRHQRAMGFRLFPAPLPQ